MNKKELVDTMQTALDEAIDGISFTKADTDAIIHVFEKVITSALAEGKKVAIPGLGTFVVAERAARTARNPQTGEVLEVAAYKAPKFKASKGFKELIRG